MINSYFENIENVILKSIHNSQKNICIAMAWFTNLELFEAVMNCLKQDVKVTIILSDDDINKSEMAPNFNLFVEKGGKLFFMTLEKGIMHNKFCVIDGKLLITGSYNWTYYAEYFNKENILLTDDKRTIEAYINCFSKMRNGGTCAKEYKRLAIQEVKSLNMDVNIDIAARNFALGKEYIMQKPINVSDIEHKPNLIVTEAVNRTKPKAKFSIGVKVSTKDGNENGMLFLIKRGQELPFSTSKPLYTTVDNQSKVKCNVRYGNSDNASENYEMHEFLMEDIPSGKAREVNFELKITLDTNGYIHIEFVCRNNGNAQETTNFMKELIEYGNE
jgi:hypothetical protein